MHGLQQYRLDIAKRKKSDIVGAATDLFSGQGFTNTTMAQIAHEADVSTATIYKHFGSKEVLFAAVVQSVASQESAEIPRPKARDLSVTQDYVLGCLVAEGSSIVKRVGEIPADQKDAVKLVKETFSHLVSRYSAK